MGDADLVWVRGYSVGGREVLTLARESEPTRWLTAADVREILGDEPPVVAYDDSGPGGAIIFPADGRRHESGHPLDVMLAEQLRTAIRRRALAQPCPAESFPEPGVADVADVADDFDEPAGGEAARVAAEEAAHLAALRSITVTPSKGAQVSATQEYSRAAREGSALEAAAKAAAAAFTPDAVEHHRYHGWKSGDRFVVNDRDDAARSAAALYLWPTWGGHAAGHVISRCEVHHTGHDTSPGILIVCEGIKRPIVVSPSVLSACAKKVTA